MNCWEFKKCERLPGKSQSLEFGVCPAYTIGIGNAVTVHIPPLFLMLKLSNPLILLKLNF
jgi:hypothetical protein